MPFYFPLRYNFSLDERQRAAEKLLALRQQIRHDIPSRTSDDTLLLATWNIRNFDSNRFGHGPRLKESFFYIAEILAAFDLIAVQEVDQDLSALNTVMRILGDDWDYITTDTTAGTSGNQERMAYIFDRRKVRFQKIAGEIVLPSSQLVEAEKQFARTPFLVSFQSGWFRFMICTVHIYYGEDSGPKLARRIEEIDRIAAFLAQRADDESANYVLLGDFNIVSPEHQTMQALRRSGFIVPEALSLLPSNMRRDRHYDQIAFKAREGQVQFADQAGVFDYYRALFTQDDAVTYLPTMRNVEALQMDAEGKPLVNDANVSYYLDTWRTFQMSDHLPMWVALRIDFAEQYLNTLATGIRGASAALQHPLSFSMPELERS